MKNALSITLLEFKTFFAGMELDGGHISATSARDLVAGFEGMAREAHRLEAVEDYAVAIDIAQIAIAAEDDQIVATFADPKIVMFPGVRRERNDGSRL